MRVIKKILEATRGYESRDFEAQRLGDLNTFLLRFLPFKGATSNLEPAATKRVGPALGALWGYFGVTLGPVLVSVGDLASLDGHFAIIVESLWV